MDDLDLGATLKGFIPGQKVFNRYTLKKILGRGGMGVVWLARDEELERDVALKFLPEVVTLDKQAVYELKRETRRSLELTHSHIVRIYDFVQDSRTAAISMEYVPGDTLAALKMDQPDRCYQPEQLGKWVRQLTEALDYAHQKAELVHRDLKPANLMIDGRGDLKIADFGIAASVSDSVSRVSQQAGSSGTPVYMSPQQMMGEKPAVSDDIYALGATLYDLLTGKPPFHSGNIMMQVQSKVPATLAERRAELNVPNTNIPAEWEATIAACLAKEAKDRPQSAGEVLERLNFTTKSTKPEPVGPDRRAGRTETTPSGQSKIGNRNSKIAAVAAIAVIAVAGWYFGLHTPEQRRIDRDRLRVEQTRIESERQQAEASRIAAEREAEAQRIEAARIAAEQEAERERLAAEQARLAAARGGIIVRTTPAGAEVRVGAVALDKSPLNLKDQRLGKYPVRVRLEGYEDWDGEVEVKENEFTELNVPLVRSVGTVTLSTEPVGMDYAIRGEVTRTGRTPAELNLPTGRYDITFRRPGWPEQAKTVEVRKGASVNATAEFVPGSLELTSVPNGAEVWAGGKQVDVTPYRVAEALPGRYDYELRLPRHKPATATLTVQARQSVRENVRLEAKLFPEAGQPHENSLGMKFVPVPGTNVLFSIWETRVQDYQQFVNETRREWPKPDFSQGSTHPAVMITHDDAVSFCQWLTEAEQREGRLAPNQEYRLPTDAEWSIAVGPDEFPWGNQWPPPQGAGNYADEAAKRARYTSKSIISGYDDGFAATAPVGSFTPNRHGLYDMGGNVWERIDHKQGDWFRGASFVGLNRAALVSSTASGNASRLNNVGFRVVVAVGSGGQQSRQETVGLEKSAVPEKGKTYTIPDLNLEILPMPAGTFQMGSASGGLSFERPVTRVTISRAFWLGKTEVTQGQWQAVMGNNPSNFKGANLPVERVSWEEAMEFCRRLTERERSVGRLPAGYVYTLPTEAQWEYACRAGTTGDYAGDLNSMAWYDRNSGRRTQPVGTKQSNAWGLHDMHGNLAEWCLDWFGLYKGGSVTDPLGASSSDTRVSRGGSWRSSAAFCRSAHRDGYPPHDRGRIGFRIALAPSP